MSTVFPPLATTSASTVVRARQPRGRRQVISTNPSTAAARQFVVVSSRERVRFMARGECAAGGRTRGGAVAHTRRPRHSESGAYERSAWVYTVAQRVLRRAGRAATLRVCSCKHVQADSSRPLHDVRIPARCKADVKRWENTARAAPGVHSRLSPTPQTPTQKHSCGPMHVRRRPRPPVLRTREIRNRICADESQSPVSSSRHP